MKKYEAPQIEITSVSADVFTESTGDGAITFPEDPIN